MIICLIDEVMGTDNWKKMQEENPAALCALQKMVLTAPTSLMKYIQVNVFK